MGEEASRQRREAVPPSLSENDVYMSELSPYAGLQDSETNSDTSTATPWADPQPQPPDSSDQPERGRVAMADFHRMFPGEPDADGMSQDAMLDLQRRLAAFMDDLDDLPMEDEDGFILDLDLVPLRSLQTEPNYPHADLARCECTICFDTVPLRKRLCCDFAVCDRCMTQYLETQVNQGIVQIDCVSGVCEAHVYRDEVLARLSTSMKDRYYKFLVDANKDPRIKTCPRCSHIYKLEELGSTEYGKFGVHVMCPECQLDWCFECHAPWHEDVKCRDYRRGDKLLKSWAREHHYGHNNAQRCPKCKIFIERKGGCDHMVCSQCNTSFCYRCGERFLELKFFGSHLSRLSPLGCKYNFKPDKPVTRKLIRGSVFSATVLAGLGLLGVGVAAVGVLIGASVVIVPVAVGYKYHKYRKRKKQVKRQQELFRQRTRNALMELHRERAVLERAAKLSDGGETVHVGVQAGGQAQQVNVTVHKPYQPTTSTTAAATAAVAQHTTELAVSATDSSGHTTVTTDSTGHATVTTASTGHATVTTAELAHSSTPGADGSTGEVVLHVKTTYCKPESEPQQTAEQTYEGAFEAVMDEAVSVSEEGGVQEAGQKGVGQKGAGHQEAGSQLQQAPPPQEAGPTGADSPPPAAPDNSCAAGGTAPTRPLAERSNSLNTHSSKSSKQSKSGDSETGQTGRRSEYRRCLHGSLSKNGSLSKKHMKGSGNKSSETTGLQTSLTVPDLGQGEGMLGPGEGLRENGDGEGEGGESLSQSGCFMALFSKKLTTLHSQFERERQTSGKPGTDDGPRLECPPDIVTCAVQAELKNADSIRDDQGSVQDKVEVDRFLGIIAKETYTTQL